MTSLPAVVALLIQLGALPTELPPERISFTLPMPEEHGGGKLVGEAGAVEYRRDVSVLLSDGLRLEYQDMTLRADQAEVDLAERSVTASGNVILDQGPNRLAGATLSWDLDTRTGTLTEATVAADPDIFFAGQQVAKVAEDTYTVDNGVFTSCKGEVPAWSFTLKHANVEMGGYARVKSAGMRVKRVPIFYMPYILWPAKEERTSGLLMPNLGYSQQRGAYLGLAYFQTLGTSYDATFYGDYYTEKYYGGGIDFRYKPREDMTGFIRGYAINDPVEDEIRWKIRANHESSLPLGMRAVVSYEDYSDFQFFQDFERRLAYNSRPFQYSFGFATGSWGNQSFNLLVDDREVFSSASTQILRQLPEMEYVLRPTQIGGLPLYLELSSGLHYFQVERSETLKSSYGRADILPLITVPLSPAPWLTVSARAGARYTWYGDSLGRDEKNKRIYTGETLSRFFPTGSLNVVGPSFTKIFGGRLAGFDKFKHIIEPKFDYTYVGGFDDQASVPLFDQVDALQAFNLGTVWLVNRLLAKSETLAAREILAVELGRSYSFDDERPLEVGSDGESSPWGPWVLNIRSYPNEKFGLRLGTSYSGLFGQLTSVSLSSYYSFGVHRVSLAWMPRWRSQTGEILSNQGNLGLNIGIIPGKLHLMANVAYDFERSLVRDQRYFLTINGSCYSFRMEYHENQTSVDTRRDYLFAVDLKNVGTFFDITGGTWDEF